MALAVIAGGDTHVFGGFLLNPLDGNSYLAKMQQGASGSWRFTLPFTPEPGEGAYLFLFYLALGHLCRLTGAAVDMDVPYLAGGRRAVFDVYAVAIFPVHF